MSSIKVRVNPRLLAWARMSAGFSIPEAAGKIGVKDGKIKAWESNQDKPTVAQLRKAAQVYKRPLSIFFLSEIPGISLSRTTSADCRARLPMSTRRDLPGGDIIP